MQDIMRVPPGSIEHGEYNIVILGIPGRTHKFFKIRGLKRQREEVYQSEVLQTK